MLNGGPSIDRLRASAYKIPTDSPEADGTLLWSSTTLVLAEVSAAGVQGIGWTYADSAAAGLINWTLREVVEKSDAFAIGQVWESMRGRLRNIGCPGVGWMAISAIDFALWDLKARLLRVPLPVLVGMEHDSVPVYGSGGFTSYSTTELQRQLGGWVSEGIPRVKMKIGSSPENDPQRVHAAREAIGPRAQLFVDANGAYERKQAIALAEVFAEQRVAWFEEPVSSDDLEGLHLIRDRAPAELEIAAGEYGWDSFYFRRMLEAQAVDVLQIDATRAGGITGFLRCAHVADAFSIPVSGHTAPAMHLVPCLAAPRLRHLEYFHDHVRIEQMLFDGIVRPVGGALHPDLSRPGNGYEFKRRDAEKFSA